MPDEAVRYAGFQSRVGALLIDIFLVWLSALIVGSVIAAATGADENGFFTAVYLSGVVGTWLYYAVSESSEHQATLGKRALGIIVTDIGGERISFARATGRFLGKSLSALILGFGYFFGLFTQRKQALHDLLASTVVVHRHAVWLVQGGSGRCPRLRDDICKVDS